MLMSQSFLWVKKIALGMGRSSVTVIGNIHRLDLDIFTLYTLLLKLHIVFAHYLGDGGIISSLA